MRGVGVVGVGVWGCHSLEQTLAGTGRARVVAVSTEDRWGETQFEETPAERGRAYADGLGAGFVDDWRQLVRHPDVDIVSVMVCPREKGAVIEEALRCGKHVVTDKPLAGTVEEARRIVAAERSSAGRGFMLAGYHTRPLVRLLCERVACGGLGELRAVTIRLCFMGGVYPGFCPTARWRSEIPSAEMTTIGSHALVTMLRLVGRQAAQVYGVSANRFYDRYAAVGAEDWAELQLAFEGGVVGSILAARLPHRVPGEDIVIEVTGTGGYAHLGAEGLTLWPGSECFAPPRTSHNALAETFGEYLDALDSGAAVPTSFGDGLALQCLLDAAIRSAGDRRVYPVENPAVAVPETESSVL